MKYFLITLCASLVSVNFASELPLGFKKCDVKQSSSHLCLTKAVEDAIKQMNHPIKELGFISLEPLEIPSLTIDATSQLVATQQIYHNMKLSGFNETSCSKVDFNFDTKTLNLDCVVPHFRAEFYYEIHGQVLLMSLYGKGTGWFILEDNHMQLSFALGQYEKKGRTYFNVVRQQLKMQFKDLVFDVDNLFNGDEELAGRVKKILRENANELFNEVKFGYEDAFGKIFASIFEKILSKVPAFDIFGYK